MLHPPNTYRILETDIFDPFHYPLVVKELTKLSLEMMHLPMPYRSEIVISFLKDHTVQANWAQLNTELVDFMKSQIFPVIQLEYLFESCRNNMSFLSDFEAYIKCNVLRLSTMKAVVF